MSRLLLIHTSTIQCDHCIIGEHTGESNASLEDAYTKAAAAVVECRDRRAAVERAMADSNRNHYPEVHGRG